MPDGISIWYMLTGSNALLIVVTLLHVQILWGYCKGAIILPASGTVAIPHNVMCQCEVAVGIDCGLIVGNPCCGGIGLTLTSYPHVQGTRTYLLSTFSLFLMLSMKFIQ